MKTYCGGYLRFGSISQYKFIDDVYYREVDAEFLYYDTEDYYDKSGNPIGRHEINHRSIREKKITYEHPRLVIQFGYDFFLFADDTAASTINELYEVSDLLNKFKVGVFDVEYNEISRHINRFDDYYPSKSEFVQSLKPYEICHIGATRYITLKNINDFINLDYSVYTERKNRFIEKIKAKKLINTQCLIDQVNYIYKCNITLASLFYNIPEDKIIVNNFSKPAKLIERLQKKIHKKQHGTI